MLANPPSKQNIFFNIGLTDIEKDILFSHPAILATGDDHCPCSPIEHDLLEYISVNVNGDFCGAFVVIKFSPTELEVHNFTLPEAVMWSRSISNRFVSFAFDTYGVNRITGWIREDFRKPLNMYLKMGFTLEGIKRESVFVNGVAKSLYMVGITKKDWSMLK